MADEIDKTKITSPIPGMNLAEFEAHHKATKEEMSGWNDNRRAFVFNILLDESIRFQWKSGGAPAVMMYAIAMSNHMNRTLSAIYVEEGIQPVEHNTLEMSEMPHIDRNKMN